jgi:murein L,D-transpeptidase YcbB/YkuD
MEAVGRRADDCVFILMLKSLRHERGKLGSLSLVFVAAFALCAQAPRDDVRDQTSATEQLQPDTVSTALRALIDAAQWKPSRTVIDWRRVRAFYTRRNFEPAWSDPANEQRAHEVLDNAGAEGLSARDYAADSIQPPSDGDPGRRARYDLLLTNSLLHYAHDVREGRIAPDEAYQDADYRVKGYDDPAELEGALRSGGFDAFLKSLPPPQDGYRSLRDLLSRYRQIAANGGWQRLPADRPITLRRKDPLLSQLNERLAAEDRTYAAGAARPSVVRQALLRFQRSHGLNATGSADKDTIAELNVDVGARIARIEANMERWRWLPRAFEQRYVEVNVPAAYLNVVDSGQVVLSSRVVVGRGTDPTPLLRADATSITINPVWHIPSKIARKEILPKLRHDHSYLRTHHIEIVDRSTMKLKQLPGPKNALGAIKIDMPNRFNVYLHDTPGQSVFAKNMRDESHGCMRVEQILPLASIALTGNAGDAIQDLIGAIDSEDTQKVPLPAPLPIYVVYWSVTAADDGSAQFWPDIYGRDDRLISELQKRNVGERLSVL